MTMNLYASRLLILLLLSYGVLNNLVADTSQWQAVKVGRAAGLYVKAKEKAIVTDLKSDLLQEYAGIYPHLAMFNSLKPEECGVGAAVSWQGSLYTITYSGNANFGSHDKLYRIDPDLSIHVYKHSLGGTPACRMIHEESRQLFIGPYAIDHKGHVRNLPFPDKMPGRLTGIARHLTDPANKLYYATMEEGLYEIDVHTLKAKTLFEDYKNKGKAKGPRNDLPGTHGKGLYSSQGRLVYSNNGNYRLYYKDRQFNKDPGDHGVLAEWDGKRWRNIHRTGFNDVTGPGGIHGNKHPQTDPLWAIGWDYRSVILKVLDHGVWHTYRLPKASHTFDGLHGINTEWPRIGEIGSRTERLLYTHGMFYRFPNDFSSGQSAGIRPRSTYLKKVSDSALWQGRIVFASNDAVSHGAVRRDVRKARGGVYTQIPHSNLWFVKPERLDQLGPVIGRGAVWENDRVLAGKPSEPYLFAGFDKRCVQFAHQEKGVIQFTLEFDHKGNGQWQTWRTVNVHDAQAYHLSLKDAPDAEWVRIRIDRDARSVTAFFQYANQDRRAAADAFVRGIADRADGVVGGVIHTRASLNAPLAMKGMDLGGNTGYYELNTDMRLVQVPAPVNGEGDFAKSRIPINAITADKASVLYIDEEDGKRYRLPRASDRFDKRGPFGPARLDRNLTSEASLFNAYGTFYELPYRNAGGTAMIRPIATHNLLIHDYSNWRGMMVLTGIDLSKSEGNERIIVSDDGKAACWVGALDDLWQFGKVSGYGGPWLNTAAKANVHSDPYLMTGYDRKTMALSHQSDQTVRMTVEVDLTGYGDWVFYQAFDVKPQQVLTHIFPEDFNAYWVRASSDQDTIASMQLKYE